MAKTLTVREADWASTLLHDLFEAGGLLKRSIRTSGTNSIKSAGETDAARALCDEIKYRNFDFPKLDSAIRSIAKVDFRKLHDRAAIGYLSTSEIANILADFCAKKEIFWDDVNSHKTTIELETFRLSLLGKACWEFGCFLSQSASSAETPIEKPEARASAAGTRAGAKKSTYKDEGPKSGLIKGLIGKPGEKITFPKRKELVTIMCLSEKPKKQYVYVDPIRFVSDVNKIKFGDPSGYSTCKLYFDSLDTAADVIRTIKLRLDIPDHVTGFTVKKEYAEPNGYFKINTEVGPAYIKAEKLNEEIVEEITETTEAPTRKASRFPKINDIDTYAEAMFCRD